MEEAERVNSIVVAEIEKNSERSRESCSIVNENDSKVLYTKQIIKKDPNSYPEIATVSVVSDLVHSKFANKNK